jgi:hypothetical protein
VGESRVCKIVDLSDFSAHFECQQNVICVTAYKANSPLNKNYCMLVEIEII